MKKRKNNNQTIIGIFDDDRKCKSLSSLTDEVIYTLLDIHEDNYTHVAKLLGISHSAVYTRLRKPRKKKVY